MSEIIPDFLWLGSSQDARDKIMLEKNGITHILNCSDDVENYYPGKFTYLQLHVKDGGRDEGISRVFKESMEYLNNCKNEGNKVLVHCFMGINRSTTITLVYLMKANNMSLKEAWRIVKMARDWVSPFEDNIAELIKFEKEERGENTMDEDDFCKMKMTDVWKYEQNRMTENEDDSRYKDVMKKKNGFENEHDMENEPAIEKKNDMKNEDDMKNEYVMENRSSWFSCCC